jgi:glycosyltransferase involved in cell wall biosynthesis
MRSRRDGLRVLLLARYGRLGASTRVRSLQYLPALAAEDVQVDVAPLLPDAAVARLYAGARHGLGTALAAYGARLLCLLRARSYDVLWVEKELFPWLPAWADLGCLSGRAGLVLDYDDAVFHRYDAHSCAWVRRVLGRKIDALMRVADAVIVGNDYLGERARRAGARRVEKLPTVVDTERYGPAEKPAGPYTLGWIGTPKTARYLDQIAAPLAEVALESSGRVTLIGAGPEALAGVSGVERRPWSEASEVAELLRADVGVMPLPDEPFERGKCGYKLVQFLACGKPVVASPVGVNAELVVPGENGFLARTSAEWRAALSALRDPELRARLGARGRELVCERYSLAQAAPRLARVLWSAARGGSAG